MERVSSDHSINKDLSTSESDISIISDIKFNNTPLEEKKIEKRKKHYKEAELESKLLAEEKYKKERHEQLYKQFTHLLKQSQFYSNYIFNKTIKSMDKEEVKKNRNKTCTNENLSFLKKKKNRAKLENDMRVLVSNNVQKKLYEKRKLNLSTEEIESELSADSDTEIKDTDSTAVAPKYFCGVLRDYQQKGLQWLKILYENGLNGILADEMGLGKTIQVIALICHLVEKQQAGPYLIIAPLSTVPNWFIEFEKFAPDIPVLKFHGNLEERAVIYKKIAKKFRITDDYSTQPVIITTFDMPMYDIKFFQEHTWRYIIIDEGQRIKNYNCNLVKVLKKVRSLNKLLLTGTPLQNNLTELWSLLNFLLPEIFDNLSVFESWFDINELQHKGAENILKQEEEKQVLSSIRDILKPFMLRRVKSDVCLEIPPKKELIVYAPLTKLQHDLYRAVLNYDIETLTKIKESIEILPTIDGKRAKRKCVLRNKYELNVNNTQDSNNIKKKKKNQSKAKNFKDEENLLMWKQYTDVTERNQNFLVNIKLQNRLVMYKKIVNHPYLVHWPLNSVGLPLVDNELIKSSGKLLVLDAMLAKLKTQGHKVLLFSTMTMILDMIEDYLSLCNYKYVRLDGKTKIEIRQQNIESFNNNPNIFLFLISTRAGGIGLNLAGADSVIIYDSDWNPQVDIQAMARCHRIGQTKPVVIYKLCTKGTIDEEIMKRSEAKRILEKIVISKEWRSTINNKDNLLRLKNLLESTEYKIITSKNNVFTETELEKLLDRSDLNNIITTSSSSEK